MSLCKHRRNWAMLYIQTFIVLFLTFLTSKLALSVKINRLEVPEVALPGTPIVLDCDYSVEKDEGLVVKWFFNDKKTLIYQWIPDTKPVTLGILKGRVNLDYSASTDINSVHRALQIIKPGPDLSGDYTCAVSSYFSEDMKTKSMLVVDPGKSLELRREFQEKGLMKIICSAEGVFPQPSMQIHIKNSEVNNSMLSIHKRAGLFDAQVMVDVPILTSPEEFSCELHIPQANFTIRKEAVYYPDNLDIIKGTCVLWFRSRFLIRMIYFSFVAMVFYVLLLFYEIYSCGIDLKFLLSYGANIFSNIYFLLTSFIFILQGKEMKKLDRYIKKNFLDFSEGGKNVNRSILKKTKYAKYLAFFLLFTATMDTVSLLPIVSDKSGLLYVIMMMKKYKVDTTVQKIHSLLYYIVHFFVFELCWSYVIIILYFILHLNLQYILLAERLRNMEALQDSGNYHQDIRKRLSIIIRHYQKISRYHISLENLFRMPFYFVVWLGLFAFIFVSYMLTTQFQTDIDLDTTVTVFVVWITIAVIAVLIISYCQFYADQNNEFWNNLCLCRWYQWNNSTQKTYRILLAYVAKQRVIQAGGVIRIDFSFVIWFGRKTASCVAFLTTIEERNFRK